MAQQLRVPAALAEDPSLLPRAHLSSLQSPVTQALGGPKLTFASIGTHIHMYIPTERLQTNTYVF